MRFPVLCTRCVVLGAALSTSHAHAQTATSPNEHTTLTYAPAPRGAASHSPNALRLTLEELAILIAGLGYYYYDHEVNSQDWTYDYEWSTLQEKLTGSGYAFDTNHFSTNTLSHSGAGALYYVAARGNRLTVAQSLATAFLGSIAWEVFAEFRERISINDFFVTPLGGFAFGEAMTQVGALFDRGCDSTLFRVLGSTFAPSRALHDWLDGAAPERAQHCDANGFSTRGRHAIRLTAGSALGVGGASSHGRGWIEVQGQAEVEYLPRTADSPRGWRAFSDGNLARLAITARGTSEQLHSLSVQARSLAFGAHYWQPLPHPSMAGSEAVIALGAGVLYSQRLYSPALSERQLLFSLEAPALYAHWRYASDQYGVRLSVTAAPTLSQAGAFALPVYSQHQALDALTPVAQRHGYNHALGVVLNPQFDWWSPFHELALSMRSDRMVPIRVLIGDDLEESDVSGSEARRQVRLSAAVGEDPRVRFRTDIEWELRAGRLGRYRRRVQEFTWTSGIEIRY